MVGFWLETGSRDEPKKLLGVSHLIEHLVFKGTKSFTALDIAHKLEAVGGEINAFTTKEHVCFHTNTLKEDLELCVHVLSELMSSALFDEEAVEKEKKVVLQEMLMSKDDIEDSVFDNYFLQAFPKNPLGANILGTSKSVSSITQKEILDWYKTMYAPNNLIVSVTGNVEHAHVVDLVSKYLGKHKKKKIKIQREAPQLKAMRQFDVRESEQVHAIVSLPTVSYGSDRRFEAFIVNSCLGGGMTSKLFQNIREEKGWVYSIFSMLNTYTDFGVQMIYAATESGLYKKVVEEILKELRQMKKKKLTTKDLDFFRRQVRGQLLMAAEDLDSRMHSLAINEMVYGEYRPVQSVIDEMKRIKLDGVNNYIDTYFDEDQMGIYLLGDLKEKETHKWLGGL
ncbi:MAG: insulinase family protein [Bdellovibrionaceae bacterium]|nr:insulinase family protein [Pseudobdellovibrionaceae bacterium]